MSVTLRLEEVELVYAGGTRALQPLNLELEKGEFVSLLGPSGCGKSSLLRIAAGLTVQTGGRVHVERSQIGFTFQDATLLPWRTVLQNVELPLELRGQAAAERRRAANDALRLVGLEGFGGHYPRQLSGGMRMRVSLARSLTLEPRLMLFDEPFGALDEITRERLNDELLALHARQRFSALFVTHSVSEAVFLSQRVLVMSARPGRVVAEFRVPFDGRRDAGLRYSAEFSQLCAKVSSHLRATVDPESSAA